MHTFTSAIRRSITAALVAVSVMAFAAPAYASSSYHNDNDDYRSGKHYNSNSNWRYDNRDYDSDRIPSCWITASPNTAGYGGTIRLVWESSEYADYADITDIGRVEIEGERVINVYDSKTYYMTVYNDGKSSTCSTLVNIPGDEYRGYPYYRSSYQYYNYNNQYPYYYNYTTPTYTYPTTYTYPNQYLALSQIPYTGGDFGFAGTLLAWLGVILAAALGASFLAYRFGFAQRALALLRR